MVIERFIDTLLKGSVILELNFIQDDKERVMKPD